MAAPPTSLCRDITEMTKLDEGWMRKKLIKRRKRYRARLSKLIPQKRNQRQSEHITYFFSFLSSSTPQSFGLFVVLPEPTPELVELYKKFKDERSKLGQTRISGLKKIIEREREDAELEKQTIVSRYYYSDSLLFTHRLNVPLGRLPR